MADDRIKLIERRAKVLLKPTESSFLLSALRQYKQQGSIRGLLIAAGRVLLKPKKLGILNDCRPLVMERHLQIFDEEVFVWKQTSVPPGASSFSGSEVFLQQDCGGSGGHGGVGAAGCTQGLIVVTIKNKRGASLGFSVHAEGSATTVSTVSPNTEAFKSGLRVGDAVIAIDQTRTSGLKYSTITTVLAEAASGKNNVKIIVKPASLAASPRSSRSHKATAAAPQKIRAAVPVAAAGRPRASTPTVQHITFRNPGGSNFGVRMSGGRFAGDPMLVDAVIPGSAAHLAGLRPGTQILGANGIDFSKIARERVSQIIQANTMLTLAVRVPRLSTAPGPASAQRSSRPVARSSPRISRSAEPAVQHRRRSSSSRPTAKAAAPAPQGVPKMGGKSRKGLKMSTIKAMLNAVQDFPTKESAANAVRRSSRVTAAVRAQPRPNPAAAAKRRTPPRTRVSREVFVPSVKIALTPPEAPKPATARRNSLRSRANVMPSHRAGITLPTIVEPPHSSTDSPGPDSFGDDLGSPIPEAMFERRGAGMRRRSSSDSEPIYDDADAMNTSGMYGFDDSFATEEDDQMEYADWARNTYTTIDNPQGSSNTDDIYAQPFKTKKDAESARATRQVFAAPVAAPVAPPLPPRGYQVEPATSGRSAFAPVTNNRRHDSSVGAGKQRANSKPQNRRHSLTDEITKFRKDGLKRVSSPSRRRPPKSSAGGANDALVAALKRRLSSVTSGSSLLSDGGLDQSWMSNS